MVTRVEPVLALILALLKKFAAAVLVSCGSVCILSAGRTSICSAAIFYILRLLGVVCGHIIAAGLLQFD
jgi:hypothetical protein